MKSPYESPENLVASALFSSIFIAVAGVAMLGVAIWAIATGRADAPTYAAVPVALIAWATSLYFFGQYREQKRERVKRQEEKLAKPAQKV